MKVPVYNDFDHSPFQHKSTAANHNRPQTAGDMEDWGAMLGDDRQQRHRGRADSDQRSEEGRRTPPWRQTSPWQWRSDALVGAS